MTTHSEGAGSPPFPALATGSRTEVVLAPGGVPVDAERPLRLRRILAPVIVAALAVAAVVGVAGWLIGRSIAEQQAVHDVAELTDLLAESVVQPALTDRMLDDPELARRVLDPIVHNRVLSGELVRAKVWQPDGTVLYSDQPALMGQHFDLEDEAQEALRDSRVVADITDLTRPENRLERSAGRLLEVYRPVWTPNGRPLILETYFRYDAVDTRREQLWRGFGGVMLSSLAALLLLLVPLIWAGLTRARRGRAQREKLMRRALDASEEERRRIAATLHDGVVQQLAAAAFLAAGAATRADSAGQAHVADDTRQVAATVRDGLAGLRSLLVDIYPPTLRSSGLAVALHDLARTSAAGEAEVETEIDADVADGLPPDLQQAAFRVAQEALRNAIKHADARHLRLSLHGESGPAVLEVEDDGRGFDPASAPGEQGHFGVPLMTDTAHGVGAELVLASAPGHGTLVRMELA